ncbi:guanylate kinase [Breoghania corrubedonensis]|uniref:Guanylate kinase n=1 Tax=Breoghania corrubedonensis TaxID=665038 RepID=A0A2T5V9M2_9HYPH|nr:guanylate kinase [Breoghania corrubedonensis]PTW60440.1 guanylate kinase [Breoghania corrubedonensis]
MSATPEARKAGETHRRGLMFVLSSPSGAGKSTIARSLLESDRELMLSVSVTTRERRPSEIDGVHYHFISKKRFLSMREDGDLLESAEVHGNFYGTPRAPVETALSNGNDILFDIDWQGTLQLFDAARPDVASVFILPPSMKELRSRLERRAEDSAEVIERRLQNARTEISHWNEYDYVLINDDLDQTFQDVQKILCAERRRRERNLGMEYFVDQLQQEA